MTLANEASAGSGISIIAIIFAVLHIPHNVTSVTCVEESPYLARWRTSSRLSEGSLGTILEDATSPLVIKISTQGSIVSSCGCICLLVYDCNVTHCDPLRTPRVDIVPPPANDLAPCSCALMRPACTAMRRWARLKPSWQLATSRFAFDIPVILRRNIWSYILARPTAS